MLSFYKTILCSRIVEHLSATSVKFVAYFFLLSDHESRNDPYAVVRSWLSQLAAQPDVYDLIRPKWETTQDQVAPRATVVQLLRDVLQARPGCILGVDVLDECTAPADSSSSITRFLEDVKNAITPATRVLVNCRDEPEIRQTLRANDSYSLAKYQISPRDVHDDASAFSRSIVDRKLANKPEDIRASLSKTITDRSDCQFLWLLLQEQSLKSWKTLVQLRRGLDSTPAGLNNLYERNWTKITRSDRADRAGALLRWAAFALWPLTLGEITEAVLIEEEYEGLPTDELPDVIDDDYISSEIVKLCGPLVEVRGPRPAAGARIVHLAHFTVREFLFRQLPTGNIWQKETLRASNECVQNTILARSCL
ncbi:Vegetative incompatibility protein HET-E-1 like [Verticillium longisporum]|nr:Vegetative incompatibility protein HET-E-1 like [Verticillium longisporum]